jgi:formate dehydrogenase accessory protein FdhD
MMGTPSDLEDFAAGFSLTEGIVESFEEIRAIEAHVDGEAARVEVALTGDRLRVHLARRRAVAGRTGCGVCGIEDLEHLPKARRRSHSALPPSPAAVGFAVEALDAHQPLNALTRAVHGAAWCDARGQIVLAREDVGRHNALDKCIGALLREGVEPASGFFIVTSRCSYEMVTKAAAFRRDGARDRLRPHLAGARRGENCRRCAHRHRAARPGVGVRDLRSRVLSHGKIEIFGRMANQIGDYYAPQPPDQGAQGVATHIRKFWTPKMIQETLAELEQQNLTLNETAARGFAILRKEFANAD